MLTWMYTYPCKQKVDFISPDPRSIMIADIANALANICRFNGHMPGHYSVAQHSVYVAQLVPLDLALAALLHDAPEAYTGDQVSPYKALLRDAPAIEGRIALAIEKRFDVRIFPMAPEVKAADLALLVMEAKSLLGVDAVKEWGIPPPAWDVMGMPIHPWPAEVAKEHFLAMFYRLTQEYARALIHTNGSFSG